MVWTRNVTASIDYTNFSLVENTSWEYLNNLSRRVIIWSLSVAQERENIECKKRSSTIKLNLNINTFYIYRYKTRNELRSPECKKRKTWGQKKIKVSRGKVKIRDLMFKTFVPGCLIALFFPRIPFLTCSIFTFAGISHFLYNPTSSQSTSRNQHGDIRSFLKTLIL